jgi:hypothetical protein
VLPVSIVGFDPTVSGRTLPSSVVRHRAQKAIQTSALLTQWTFALEILSGGSLSTMSTLATCGGEGMSSLRARTLVQLNWISV